MRAPAALRIARTSVEPRADNSRSSSAAPLAPARDYDLRLTRDRPEVPVLRGVDLELHGAAHHRGALPAQRRGTAQSIPKSDFAGIAGVTLHMGATYVLANTAVDLLQAAADPRLRTN
jgi:hypothetical protein